MSRELRATQPCVEGRKRRGDLARLLFNARPRRSRGIDWRWPRDRASRWDEAQISRSRRFAEKS